jgi:hypothetical protein
MPVESKLPSYIIVIIDFLLRRLYYWHMLWDNPEILAITMAWAEETGESPAKRPVKWHNTNAKRQARQTEPLNASSMR